MITLYSPDITAGWVRCWSSQHVTIPAWTRSWSAPDCYPAPPEGVPAWHARSDGNGEQEPVKMVGTAQIGHTLRSPA